MADSKHEERLDDLKAKVDNARETVRDGKAGAREKADLKILEQEQSAAKLQAAHPTPKPAAASTVDAKLDKALKDSSPGSDPVSFVQPAPVKDGDLKLSTVKSSGGKNDKT